MRKIPPEHKEIIDADPYYKKCVRSSSNCDGRITIEHALIFGGRQICELWNYVPLCTYHHAVEQYQDGGDMKKEFNVWAALNRATNEELKAYSKVIDYIKMRDRLNTIYGITNN